MNAYSSTSQVFISEYFDGDIFVGPKNVMFINDQIKEHYVADLETEIGKLDKHLIVADSLKIAKKKNRAERKRYRALKKNVKLAQAEKTFLKDLLSQWKNCAFDPIDTDRIYCIYDSNGEVIDQIVISPLQGSTYQICEFAESQLGPLTTVWEKVKSDKNCISSNPDDCMVWCLKEVQFHLITDAAGKEINVDQKNPSYFNFIFYEKDSLFYRFVEIEIEEPADVYSIRAKETYGRVPYHRIRVCEE